MEGRSEVAPDTLPIELTDDGVVVEYTDGREVFYRGVPEKVEGSLTTPPGKDVHVLVTDASETQGVLVYVNERRTEDEILRDTGVGRVLLSAEERTTVFPGVPVEDVGNGLRVTVEVEDTVDGRVFVFAEDGMGEHSYEVVPGGDDPTGSESEGEDRDGEESASGESGDRE
jgi:hypothetical protein